MRSVAEVALLLLAGGAMVGAAVLGKAGLERALGGPRSTAEAEEWLVELTRAGAPATTFALSDLPAWRTDPLLVDTAGSYPDSLQYCDVDAFLDWEGHAQGKGRIWFDLSRDSSTPLPASFFVSPPFLHLSGRSYVSLALERFPDRFGDKRWVEQHTRFMHASELAIAASLGAALTAPEAFVASLSPAELDRLLSRPKSLLTSRSFLSEVSSEEPGAPPRYAMYDREAFDRFAESKSVRASPVWERDACLITTDAICWQRDTEGALGRIRSALALALVSIVSLVALMSLRRSHRLRSENEARRFILATLTHELRTPVASLRVSLEGLRPSFDRLPDDGQSAFLRICEDLQRLQRLTEASTQYLRAKDSRSVAFEAKEIPSLLGLLEAVLEAHPPDIVLTGEDARLRCDPYWVSVCADNLVRNALSHGRPPISVTCTGRKEGATIVVEDGGEMKLAPDEMLQPFTKGEGSTGLGLGLSVVARLVEQMGGRLEIDKSPSRVALYLPHLP